MTAITPRDIWYAVTISAVMVGIIILILAVYQMVVKPAGQRRTALRRLEESSEEHLRRFEILKERSEGKGLHFIKRALGADRLANLQSQMLQADIYHDPKTFLLIILALWSVGLLAGFLISGSIPVGIIIGLFLGIMPYLYLRRKKGLKTMAFEELMPESMELLARSLRAGHTLPSAIELLGDETKEPMSTEMKVAFEEQRFGLTVQESLAHMTQRVDSQHLRYFVSAVLIQQETGGNLAELMEKIAHVIRGRLNFKAKVKALTAMGRMSAVIMIVVPVFAFFALMLVAYEYERVLLSTSTGRKMLFEGLILVIMGAILIRRLIRSVEG